MSELKNQILKDTSNIIENLTTRYTTAQLIEMNAISLADVGRPCSFPESIDPGHKMYKYFTSIMNIIKVIPCYYKINFNNNKESLKGYLPQISYDTNYPELCAAYGLPPVYGLQLYGTDDTTAADTFSNKIKPNFFQSGVNKLSSVFRNFQDVLSSFDSQAVEQGSNWSSNFINTHLNFGNEKINSFLKSSISLLTDVIAAGHKISLPGIWSDSTFSPNFTTTVKLVSPYGHPSAVKEFIIKPLIYLLLMTTPGSDDGVSYGRPLFCTIQGHGLSIIPLGQISDITLRRGGSNSSFNIYRQPLTIDVSIQFSNLVEGFAHMNAGSNSTNVYMDSDKPLKSMNIFEHSSITTVDTLVTSLYPRTEVSDNSNFVITSPDRRNNMINLINRQVEREEVRNIADPIEDTLKIAINIESQEQTENIMENNQQVDPNVIF